MRLLVKTSIYYLAIFSLVLILGGVFFYKGLKHIVYTQIDQGLLTEKLIIDEEIRHNDDIPDYSIRFGHEIEVFIFNHKVKPYQSITDTLIYNNRLHHFNPFRHLKYYGNKQNHGFSIRILHPLNETHELIQSIIKVLVIMIFFVFLSLLFFNFFISRKIWKPFYNSIHQLQRYKIITKPVLEFVPTNISEFAILNKVLADMSNQIHNDFINLKEFTENASHEIQTPLAIIKSKIEIFIQSENLTQEQIESIQAINQTISRLSKLNSGLLLITKIDNNQYVNTEEVLVGDLILKYLEIFDDFIKHKNLKVTLNMESPFIRKLHPELADILINNLINNAIKHNICNGYIIVTLTSDRMIIKNSGLPYLDFPDPALLFNRFKKNSKSSDSIGLGLAIVKKICDNYHFSISYEIEGDSHSIKIEFS